jgi:hypothetical protein
LDQAVFAHSKLIAIDEQADNNVVHQDLFGKAYRFSEPIA